MPFLPLLFAKIFLGFCLLVLPHRAFANEQMLRDYLAQAGEGGYLVELQDVAQNGDHLVIGRLTLRQEKNDDRTVTLQGLDFDQLVAGNEGGIKAKGLKIAAMKTETQGFTYHFNGLSLVDFEFRKIADLLSSSPQIDKDGQPAEEVEQANQFIVRMLDFFSQSSFENLAIEDWSFGLNFASQSIRIRGGNVVLTALSEGVLQDYAAKALIVETNTGGDDATQVTIGDMRASNYNFPAILHVLNDQHYLDGKGDGVWIPLLASIMLNDIAIIDNQATTKVAKLFLGPVRLRQFDQLPSTLLSGLMPGPAASLRDSLSDQKTDNPASADVQSEISDQQKIILHEAQFRSLVTLYDFVSYDKMVAETIERVREGEALLQIGSMQVSQYSYSDGIDLISLSHITYDNLINGSKLSFDNFSLRNICFPDHKILADNYAKMLSQSDEKLGYDDISGLFATLGGLSFDNFSIVTGNARTEIMRFDLSLLDYIKLIPTQIKMTFNGFSLPVADLPRSHWLIDLLVSLGYEKTVLEGVVEARWQEATQDIVLAESHLTASEIGGVVLQGVLAGAPREMIENPQTASLHAAGLLLKEAKISLQDQSFVDRFAARVAGDLATSKDEAKVQIGASMAAPLIFLQNPDFEEKAKVAIEKFLADGNSLTLLARPEQPLALVALTLLAQSAPQEIVKALNLTLTAH